MKEKYILRKDDDVIAVYSKIKNVPINIDLPQEKYIVKVYETRKSINPVMEMTINGGSNTSFSRDVQGDSLIIFKRANPNIDLCY
jgi:ribosomal protein L25 (general stress protein Ctc)